MMWEGLEGRDSDVLCLKGVQLLARRSGGCEWMEKGKEEAFHSMCITSV